MFERSSPLFVVILAVRRGHGGESFVKPCAPFVCVSVFLFFVSCFFYASAWDRKLAQVLICGSDPIHGDVLKIIKLFAQNLRRHFFVRKRERYCVLLMSLGVTNWPLLFEIMLDYITIFNV